MGWFQAFHDYLERSSRFWVAEEAARYAYLPEGEWQSNRRKQKQLKDRGAQIVKTLLDGRVIRHHAMEKAHAADYLCHMRHLVKHRDVFYIEESVETRRATFQNDQLYKDEALQTEGTVQATPNGGQVDEAEERAAFQYNRMQAVRYADQWWNGHNPDYRTFDVDCTNYVSQCLRAGGAPMTGAPYRDRGWWYGDGSWSYSWAVAHSLRWYLGGAQSGLRAEEVSSPEQLQPGDVICYDFDGDGRWQHNAIVTAKDADGMPLVNAHTVNRRRHYWAYEDSTAWTPDIAYKFFRIADDEG